MSGPYRDINRSLEAFCNRFLQRNGYDDTFQVFDFDAHSTTNELPADKHLIGISDYSIENQKDMYMITCVVAICTLSTDKNLDTLRDVVDLLFTELKVGATGENFAIVDSNGLKRGYMTVGDNVMALPIGRTETRPFQGIAITLGAGYLELP